jgi:outer membrane receptor protein involved in Fe transport
VYQSSLTQRSLRSALLLGAATFAAVGLAAPANADTVETVVVTGSLIPTPNATSNSPIQTVAAEAIDLSGHANIESVINQLPQIVSNLGMFSNNPGGEALLDLRGLSPNRTLVLLDGRRAMAASTSGEVDLQTIPASLVDHVDIVSGGGAATYGSDAIAGVVNFVLKKDFEGFELQARYGQQIKNSFAPQRSLNVTMGMNTADGKGNVTIYGEYYKRGGVLQGEDSRFAVDFGGGSSTPPEGRLAGGAQGFAPIAQGGGAGSACTGVSDTYAFTTASNPEGFCNILPLSSDPTANALANTIGSGVDPTGDRYNFAAVNYLVAPQKRVAIAGMGHYEILPGIEFYANAHYVDNINVNQLAPTPVTDGAALHFVVTPRAACAGLGTTPGNLNPLCDANLGATGMTSYITPAFQALIDARAAVINPGTGLPYGYSPFVVSWRSVAVGPRIATSNTDVVQMTAGFRGNFGNFLGGWDWDAYYDYGRNENYVGSQNNVLASHLGQAMLSCPVGSANGCVPVNIFGIGNLTPAMADFLRYQTNDTTIYDRQVLHGETHGDVFDLPAGPLSAAFGAEYRKDEASFVPDTAKQLFDIEGFNPAKATRGGYDVSEFFGEVRIPLLSGMDFVQYLGLEGGYRYSNYSSSGGRSTWKAGGEFQPIDDIRFRVMWQRALRAPNVNELFNGGAAGFPPITDPCATVDSTGAAVTPTASATACNNQFLAAGAGPYLGAYTQSNAQAESVGFGNPNLAPEVSNTFSTGAVITPTFLPGVTASVDYTHIAISGFIGSAFGGAQQVLNDCLLNQNGLGTRPFADLEPTFGNSCDLVTRNAIGEVRFSIPNENLNIGVLRAGSIDLQLSAQHDIADLFGSDDDYGAVDLNVAATFLTQFDDPTLGNLKGHVDPGAGLANFTGGAVIHPNFRASTRLGWTIADWRVLATWTHINSVSDPFGVQDVPSYNQFDLAVKWNFSENYSADVVVNNILDKGPKLGPYSLDGGTNALCDSYDCLGRVAYIGLTAKL